MIDTASIVITRHAWQRFKERWQGEHPESFTKELVRLLKAAQPEDIGHGAVVRAITNGFRPARYYIAEGWRFVLDEEETRLLTCERPYMSTYKKNGRRRQKH